jgi:predicted transcriptional regulator
MNNNLKQKAIKLRKLGQSVKEISKKLNVSKSSVSVWVRNIKLTDKQRERLSDRNLNLSVIKRRRDTRLFNELTKRNVIINKAKKDISDLSVSDLKIIGTMLYWAEGRKRGVRIASFSNSDPLMIKVIMRFFREVCSVPESKFRGHIHTHSPSNIKKSLEYWSNITNIPIKQFYKTYCIPSVSSKNKSNSLPNGTLDIHICSSELYLRIMGWINGVSERLINN